MRLIPYIRVSRIGGREGDSFISPDVQREAIRRHAAGQAHNLLEEAIDLDQPGSRTDRPAFQEALAMVERGEADGLIVARLDRFARSVAGAAETLGRLEAAGGALVSVDLGLDTSTPAGKLMRNVLMALAEFELDRIRESWAAARDSAIGRGVHISKVPPVGYGRGAGGRLEPDPEAAPVIRELFRRRARGDSWQALAAWMDEELPRANGGSWARQTLSSIISRRTYLGEAWAGDAVNPDAHRPLVTPEEWQAAQSAGERTPRRAGAALLAGVLRCAGCGYTLTRQSDGQRGYSNYNCRKRHAAGICPAPARISERRADEHVERVFLAWLEREGIAAEAVAASDEVARAQARVEAAEAEITAYLGAGLVSVVGAKAYREGLATRQTELEAARAALEAAERSTVALPHGGPQALIDAWPTLTKGERAELIAAAIDCVAVRQADLPGKGSSVPSRLRVYWRGEAPSDLPGRRNSSLRPLATDYAPDEVRAA